jgi:hypothetical protein
MNFHVGFMDRELDIAVRDNIEGRRKDGAQVVRRVITKRTSQVFHYFIMGITAQRSKKLVQYRTISLEFFVEPTLIS